MHYIYIDEAGTSAPEPVSVVVGIIINDSKWRTAETLLKAIMLNRVPEEFQEGFIFHAKDVWSDRKYRANWGMEARLELIKDVVGIPRYLGLPIVVGIQRRGALPIEFEKDSPLSAAQFDHLLAFNSCLTKADEYLRDYAAEGDVATVVAEDVPAVKDFMRRLLDLGRDEPFIHSQFGLRPTLEELETGFISQPSESKISRVIDTVHFIEKQRSPLLQIADACAFSFRRYFASQSFGPELLKRMGVGIVDPDWAGPGSAAAFYSHARKQRAKRPILVRGAISGRLVIPWRVQVS